MQARKSRPQPEHSASRGTGSERAIDAPQCWQTNMETPPVSVEPAPDIGGRQCRSTRSLRPPAPCTSVSVPMSSAPLALDRRALVLRALRRHHARLSRKTAGLQADLAEARGAPELRASAETLLAYLRQVPPRAERVVLPDLHDSGRNREIALDPKVAPQANAARYFKRAAKAERGLKEIPPRLAATQAERHALEV